MIARQGKSRIDRGLVSQLWLELWLYFVA